MTISTRQSSLALLIKGARGSVQEHIQEKIQFIQKNVFICNMKNIENTTFMRDQICSMTTIFFQNQWSVQNWYDAPYLANNIIKGTFALTRNLNLKKVCINKKKQKTVFNPKKNVT